MRVKRDFSVSANAAAWIRCVFAASIAGFSSLVCGFPTASDFHTLARTAAFVPKAAAGAVKTALLAAKPAAEASTDSGDGVGGASIPAPDSEMLVRSLSYQLPEGETVETLIESGSALSEELAELANAQAISEIGEAETGEEDFIPPPILLYKSYKTQKGDMVSFIAHDHGGGLRSDTIISVNNIKNTRALQQNKLLKIPNQDGIMHTVAAQDTLDSIAKKYSAYGVDARAIAAVNELFTDTLTPGTPLFVPGARLDPKDLGEINGDLFRWPVSARRITSYYGYRTNPFTGKGRTFHTGLDIGAPNGAVIRAAMYGKVIYAGWDNVFGNYVKIEHFNGYQTLYGHMSRISVKKGQVVQNGEVIGYVGSTGLSTGPHLHFGVYKNGKLTNPRLLLR